ISILHKRSYQLNPLTNDSYTDSDMDGLYNIEEYELGTDPKNSDTDGDGFSDKEEIDAGTDPLDPDSHPFTGWVYVGLAIALVIIIGVVAFLLFKKRKA
ncbi:MAG: hypothetical protein Q6363_003995, partial [Candidatus Njordarchaeota archaeon]